MSDYLNFKNKVASALQEKVADRLATLKLRMTDEMFNDGASLTRAITVEEGIERVINAGTLLEAAPNEAVIRALKPAFASEYAFYSKAHSFHWNVEGADFSEFHNLFGSIYEEVYGSIDDFAENIRKAGGYAPNSLETISELAQISSTGVIGDPLSMASDLLEDSEKLSQLFAMVYEIAESAGAYGLANFLADRQDAHDKHSWMLRSTLKRAGVEMEEEVEGLDELKASTLGSYIKKASAQGDMARVVQSLTASEKRDWAERDYKKYGKLANKRHSGVKTAADKLVKGDYQKEEVEGLDELKASTLGSYVKKASQDLETRSWGQGADDGLNRFKGEHKKPSYKKNEKKINNRLSGIKTAADKLVKGDYQKEDVDLEEGKLMGPEPTNKEKESSKVQVSVSKEAQQKSPSVTKPEAAGPGPKFGDADFDAKTDKMKPAPKFSSDEKDQGASNLVSASAKVLSRISKEEQQKKPVVSTPETEGPGPKFGDADLTPGPSMKTAPKFSEPEKDEQVSNKVADSSRVHNKISKEEQQKKPVVSTPENNPGLPSFSDSVKEGVEQKKSSNVKEDADGIHGSDRAKAPAGMPVIMNSVSSSKKLKKEAVEDLKGSKGTKTPSWEDIIKQALLTLDKNGKAVMKDDARDARTPYTANPDDETLAKVGLKKK